MAGKSATKEREEMIPQSWIKKRGWSERLIEDLLGEPDKYAVNMHYMSGPRVKFYRLSRVEAAESSEDYVSARKAGERRRAAARKGVDTKINKLREHVGTVVVDVPQIERNELLKQACDHWDSHKYDIEDDFSDKEPRPFSPAFLNRITVNYLTYSLMGYRKYLRNTYGIVGGRVVRAEIETMALNEIAKVYPWLETECQRQINELLAPPRKYF